MTLYPLRDYEGVLIVNSLVVEEPHQTAAVEPLSEHVGPNGLIVQCSHCRRVQHTKVEGRWDWAPRYLARPPARTGHGLCPCCRDFFYPGDPPVG